MYAYYAGCDPVGSAVKRDDQVFEKAALGVLVAFCALLAFVLYTVQQFDETIFSFQRALS